MTLCPTLITPFNVSSQIPRTTVQDIKYDFILVRMKVVLLLVVCDVASQDVGYSIIGFEFKRLAHRHSPFDHGDHRYRKDF